MILARLSVNLNFISLYGLPLAGTLKIDGKNFESNILISRQGLDNKLMNFGKIIVAFHKYYQVVHFVIEVQQINFEKSWFFIEKKHYFILRSLVIKYGKDIVINTVNKIVINNVKENE
ncbi:hypothetical protein C6B38_05290 [Spiroplasma sp. ChiS]|uniref:hypothetical protein n=1 Tax=Spiroplasma sp. ChiS TaxID=2099885 RepID=UPI000CF8918A|nr:hypothetical protein [Spiroplasma sp. ChiS]PQP78587.1 hypothetical protein C6B38_05290 [Spiroplasma sp. ChiS]